MSTAPKFDVKTHDLKCWPQYFCDIERGVKEFDVRKGEDRQYRVGDWLMLREWQENAGRYTGRVVYKQIKYVMHGGHWLPEDVWVMGFEKP